MTGTVTGSLVQQFASMKPAEFGPAIEPKWQLAERLIKEVRGQSRSSISRRSTGRV